MLNLIAQWAFPRCVEPRQVVDGPCRIDLALGERAQRPGGQPREFHARESASVAFDGPPQLERSGQEKFGRLDVAQTPAGPPHHCVGVALVVAVSDPFGDGHRFLGNGEGVQTSQGSAIAGSGQGHARLDGDRNPNAFVGNGIGVNDLGPTAVENARLNWWGSPTGPTHPGNPSGTGDAASATVEVLPYLASPPDFEAKSTSHV